MNVNFITAKDDFKRFERFNNQLLDSIYGFLKFSCPVKFQSGLPDWISFLWPCRPNFRVPLSTTVLQVFHCLGSFLD